MRTTLGLVVLVGVLVGVLLLTRERPDPAGNVAVPALGGARLGEATVIRWQFQGRPVIEIRRAAGGPFRLTEPVADLASVAQLRSIAGTWDSAQLAEAPLADNPENRTRTGLHEPRLVVDVTFGDGAEEHLEIGSEGALGTDLFVRAHGRIYRGGTALFSALQVGIDDLREQLVFATMPDAVTEVEVDRATAGGARERMLLRQAEGGWAFAAPIAASADTAAAISFVRQLLSLRIDQFPASVVRFPDRPADLVITIRGGAADETVRAWIDEQRNLIGRIDGRGISFVSENRQYDAIFENAVARLRARLLVPVANVHQDLVQVLVDPGAEAPRLLLARPNRDSAWTLAEPVRGAADPTAVQQLLTAVNNLRALEFHPGGADVAAYGLGPGALTVGVQEFGQPQLVHVRLGKDGSIGEHAITYAVRAGQPAEVCSVPKEAVDVLRRPWTDYVPLTILKIVQAVTRVELERPDGSRRELVRAEGGIWTVAGEPQRRERVGDIVDELRDLRGKRVLSARLLELGAADWTLRLGRADQPQDGYARLDVWERGAEAPLLVRYESGQPDLVFELSPLHSGMLRELWQ